MKKIQSALYVAAAATTVIGGIIHLILAPNSLGNNVNTGILFLIGGAAQVFWALPMIRRWGPLWYVVGIGGTAVLVAIWVITRVPANPITGRGGAISQNGLLVETMQIAYIILTVVILVLELRKTKS